MKVTFSYKPMTVTVPEWAEGVVARAAEKSARGARLTSLERETIDDLHANEGWEPAIAAVRSGKRGKR